MARSLDDPPFSHTPSSELVLLSLEGNEEAFTALYNRYTSELSRYIGGLVKNRQDRDELVVDTFGQAWQKLSQLHDPAHFRSWLYRIATNRVYDHRRRENIRQWLHLGPTDDVVCSSSFETVIEETEFVKQALQEVPWKYRTCLLLHVEGKFSKQEIAEVVKISPQSVPSYISFGREYLRQAYSRLENEKGKGR